MVRRFDGIDDVVKFAIGEAGLSASAFTEVAFMRRLSDTTKETVIAKLDSGGVVQRNFHITASDKIGLFQKSGGESGGVAETVLSKDGWELVAVGKNGGAVKPRMHRGIFSSGAWVHHDGDVTVGNSPSLTGGSFWVGSDGSAPAHMDVAAIAIIQGNLTDEEVEALMEVDAFEEWRGDNTLALIFFNQAKVSIEIWDESGNGSDQTGIVGTEVIEEDPPIDYYLPWTDFTADAESEAEPFDDFHHVQQPPGRATVVANPVAGGHAYSFALEPGDVEPETGNHRVEAISGKRYFEGDERYFRILFNPLAWYFGGWGIFQQIRIERGDEPPVCCQILEDTGKLAVMHGNGEDIYWEGPKAILGLWRELVFRVLFHPTEGEVDVWLNGEEQEMLQATGIPTMGDHPSFDKCGTYRETASSEPSRILIDGYKVTDEFFSEPPKASNLQIRVDGELVPAARAVMLDGDLAGA